VFTCHKNHIFSHHTQPPQNLILGQTTIYSRTSVDRPKGAVDRCARTCTVLHWRSTGLPTSRPALETWSSRILPGRPAVDRQATASYNPSRPAVDRDSTDPTWSSRPCIGRPAIDPSRPMVCSGQKICLFL